MRERIPDPRKVIPKRGESFSGNETDSKEIADRGVSRRSFVQGILGAGAGAAVIGGESVLRVPDIAAWTSDRVRRMRFERWDGMSSAERERLITYELKAAKDFIRGPEGTRILESGSDDELFDLIYAMPALLREHLVGTSFEVGKGEWPSVAVGVDPSDNQPFAFGLNYEKRVMKGVQRGNGVFVAPDTLLTNCHVLMRGEDFQRGSQSLVARNPAMSSLWRKYNEKFIDAVFVHFNGAVTLETDTRKPPVFPLSHLSDADVTGYAVCVQAIDPDKSAWNDETKAYFSLAIPVTKHISEFLDKYNLYGTDPYVYGSFMYIAPPGESMARPFASATGSRLLDFLTGQQREDNEYRMKGTSGSPVFMEGKLIGLNHRLGQIGYKGINLDVGFFLGPTELQKVEREMTVRAADMQTPTTYVSSYESGDYSSSDDHGKSSTP